MKFDLSKAISDVSEYFYYRLVRLHLKFIYC